MPVLLMSFAINCNNIPFLLSYLIYCYALPKSGDPLLQPDAIDKMFTQLLPRVDLITPNLPEAAALLGCDIATDETTMKQQGEALLYQGCQAVLMKGAI